MKKLILLFALFIVGITYGQNLPINSVTYKGITTAKGATLSTTSRYPVFYDTTLDEFMRWNGSAYEKWDAEALAATVTNASAITTIQGEQTTQDAAISLNTAKTSFSNLTGEVTSVGASTTISASVVDATEIASVSSKVNGEVLTYNGTNINFAKVTGTEILDATITTADMASNSVGTTNIVDGTIDEADLDTSVNASLDLADSAIQTADINTFTEINAIVADKELVEISQITAPNLLKYARFSGENTIEGLSGASLFTDVITTGSIGATQIAATAVTPGSYTATDLTVDADGRITAASNGSGGGGDDVSGFSEKTGALVGTDRLVGLSSTTDFNETISGIPLSIFNDDLTHATGDVTASAVMTDNTIIKGDGGSKGVQDSGISIDDSDNLTGVGNVNGSPADDLIVVHASSPNDVASIYLGTIAQIAAAGLATDVIALPTDATNNLDDLDDVGAALYTSGFVLVADGVDYDGRALVEADISDLGTYLTDLSGDTTPSLGGDLDMGANTIGGTAQTATGDGTTTIVWGSGNFFHFQFGAFNETFTFTAPTKPGTFLLKLIQDSTGSRTATWPASVKWPGGTAPTLTTTATTGTDIITFYYDGTDYFAVSSLDFQ